jgi:hypothetical protein
MDDFEVLESEARFERIHTKRHERREGIKNVAARLRKGHCAKRPFSRKQALTSIGAHRRFKGAKFLRSYKCPRCGHWHLTHKPQRRV